MDTWNWLYISKSHIDPTNIEYEIGRILQHSTSYNQIHQLTGALAFDGTHFTQCIEGPQTGITSLRSIIEKDPRHGEIATLLFAPIQTRKFADWTLAYSGNAVVVTRAVRRALRDTVTGEPGVGERLLKVLIGLSEANFTPLP